MWKHKVQGTAHRKLVFGLSSSMKLPWTRKNTFSQVWSNAQNGFELSIFMVSLMRLFCKKKGHLLKKSLTLNSTMRPPPPFWGCLPFLSASFHFSTTICPKTAMTSSWNPLQIGLLAMHKFRLNTWVYKFIVANITSVSTALNNTYLQEHLFGLHKSITVPVLM